MTEASLRRVETRGRGRECLSSLEGAVTPQLWLVVPVAGLASLPGDCHYLLWWTFILGDRVYILSGCCPTMSIVEYFTYHLSQVVTRNQCC